MYCDLSGNSKSRSQDLRGTLDLLKWRLCLRCTKQISYEAFSINSYKICTYLQLSYFGGNGNSYDLGSVRILIRQLPVSGSVSRCRWASLRCTAWHPRAGPGRPDCQPESWTLNVNGWGIPYMLQTTFVPREERDHGRVLRSAKALWIADVFHSEATFGSVLILLSNDRSCKWVASPTSGAIVIGDGRHTITT